MHSFFHSKAGLWTGRIVSAVPAVSLLASAAAKLSGSAQVAEGIAKLGYAPTVLPALGLVELLCVLLYLIPRTAVLGAVLLTAYLGGATATHVRLGQPFLTPVLIGVLVWAGVFARDGRLRALLPLRKVPASA
jgi:hypothetical protein